MSKFQVNDRVQLTGKVTFVGCDDSMLVILDGGPGVEKAIHGDEAACAKLVHRPKSLGQIAYDAKRDVLGNYLTWDDLNPPMQRAYEAAAQAVKDAG